jgi:hypothetical protein
MRVKSSSRLAVLALCVDRGGYREGRRVAQFIFEWELVVRSIGSDITTEEFAAWWKVGAATSYRRLAQFRTMFEELGEHATPSDLMRPLLAQLAKGELVEPDLGLAVPA